MGELPKTTTYVPEDHHHNILEAAIGDKKLARETKIHSYGKSFNGFVARLLPHEAEKLQGEDNVVSVFPNKINKLHTTRSWDFLGMPIKVKRNHNVEHNIIVGVLDTGIALDCPSFNDKGFGPVPSSWKGKCVKSANFTGCNNKVIGAKFFYLDRNDYMDINLSPMDVEGHGTHTASTAAGASVRGASVSGIGRGTSRGGAPDARIAVYKVCWNSGCSDMDLMAGFDDAIADGVNFISVSLGGTPREFFSDPMAIGAFHAMKRGILTTCSGGNSGPQFATIENVAPWIFTVAASSTDRQYVTPIGLGNGKNATGMSINTFSLEKKMYPLISGDLAINASRDGYGNASSCAYGTLSKDKVKGKIVYCLGNTGNQDLIIKQLEGAGFISASEVKTDYSSVTVIAASIVDAYTVGKKIAHYINSTKNPEAVIYKTKSKRGQAPYIASFSSRGPEFITSKILKPDLAAPGVNILAGYSKMATISGYPEPNDNRFESFNIVSGTSMACPHVAGAAAYVKSFHPEWSPAAVKSALMTTAVPMKDNAAELGTGSGRVNPIAALNPGLIYDMNLDSYIAFLCNEGYNSTSIGILIGSKGFDCSTINKPPQGSDGLNYPSMHMQVPPNSTISATFYRTVTNVGTGNSTYKAKVKAPKSISVEVEPSTLQFSKLNQELSFKVVIKGPQFPKGKMVLSASLEWSDSKHKVRSPILVYNKVSVY
ncbi:hypothetical protein PIB30_089239 [Stylosanthes scabra]|uniref:Uncharacterized protein n=1 Tax=Stylosanthes scabra TaxID=79078 RepID=A0ABU6YSR0_9FABA|nr:hypothetical protein [Stylosanthes scabra]